MTKMAVDEADQLVTCSMDDTVRFTSVTKKEYRWVPKCSILRVEDEIKRQISLKYLSVLISSEGSFVITLLPYEIHFLSLDKRAVIMSYFHS